MKKIIIVLLYLSLIDANDKFTQGFKNKIAQYDNFFTQISKKRIGVSNSEIDKIVNPFVMTYDIKISQDENSSKEIKKPTYILNAILNNKAKINGQWYRLNSKIDNFELISIQSDSVVIKKEHFRKKLFIRKKNIEKIQFSSN
ncbi:MAG: hypothetical protein JJV94_05850 [Sulfurospirillum sp.]|nr:hypothetical protein [Sulfurospirillum sp.]